MSEAGQWEGPQGLPQPFGLNAQKALAAIGSIVD